MERVSNERGERTLDLSKNLYHGRHREYELPKGVGFYPMGDRNRCKAEFGVDSVEERDSIDQYTKFLK